jgi:hypothetical protein
MSQARTNARRRRQAVNKYAHLGNSMRRPKFKGGSSRSVADAIARERNAALMDARRNASKKR